MTGQFQLNEEQLAIQEMAQRFTADNITPYAAEWDEKHHFPVDVIENFDLPKSHAYACAQRSQTISSELIAAMPAWFALLNRCYGFSIFRAVAAPSTRQICRCATNPLSIVA